MQKGIAMADLDANSMAAPAPQKAENSPTPEGDAIGALLRQYDQSTEAKSPADPYGFSVGGTRTPAAERLEAVLDRLPDDVYRRFAMAHGEPLDRRRRNPNAIAEFGPATGEDLRAEMAAIKKEALDEQAKAQEVDPQELLTGDLDKIEKGRMREYLVRIDVERRAEKSARQDAEDFERVYASAADVTAGFDVPEYYGAMWLEALYNRDAELQQIIGARYTSPQALDRAERAVTKALKGLREHVKSLPDRNATADRDAVVAAMRGASGQAPVGRAPDYSRKSNREYADAVEQEHGYRPRV
jgi:hypothetical protein